MQNGSKIDAKMNEESNKMIIKIFEKSLKNHPR